MKSYQQNAKPISSRMQRSDVENSRRQVIPFNALCDYAGREAQVSGFGDLIVGERHPDISTVFNYFINPETVNEFKTGTGANTIDASRLKLSVAGGIGVAEAYSSRVIVYRTGHEAIGMFTCAFDTAKSGTTQEAGLFDDLDGYYLSIDPANGELQANHLVNGSLTTWNQSDFNLDTLDGEGLSDLTLSPQAMMIYRISYGYLGVLPAFFEVYGGSNVGWIPFHVVDTIGQSANLILQSPSLSIRIKATSDGTNDISMYSGSWLGVSVGSHRSRSLNAQLSFNVSKAILAGVENIVGSMRVKANFQGKINKIPIDFRSITCGVDGTKSHIIRIYKNTPITNPTWADLLGPTSVVEIDLVGTSAGTSPIELKWSAGLGKIDSLGAGHNFEEGELRLVAGDTLTFTAESANASEIALAGQWDEFK